MLTNDWLGFKYAPPPLAGEIRPTLCETSSTSNCDQHQSTLVAIKIRYASGRNPPNYHNKTLTKYNESITGESAIGNKGYVIIVIVTDVSRTIQH